MCHDTSNFSISFGMFLHYDVCPVIEILSNGMEKNCKRRCATSTQVHLVRGSSYYQFQKSNRFGAGHTSLCATNNNKPSYRPWKHRISIKWNLFNTIFSLSLFHRRFLCCLSLLQTILFMFTCSMLLLLSVSILTVCVLIFCLL